MSVTPTIRGGVPPALAVEGLTKSFRGRTALADVSFAVPAGSLTVILGPAGAGKTTTLRAVAGLERPDRGRVLLRGEDAAGREPRARDVAMIFDNLALYPDKTGFENLASPLRLARRPQAEITAGVEAVAATLRISHVLRRLPRTMSGGERQRVAIGRALVREPSLFLLDEPLSSLDAALRTELRAELKRLQRERGATFLLATPDFAEALALADTVVMLRAGRVMQVADPQRLYDEPADRETARFVGAPEINLVPAAYTPRLGGRLSVAGATVPAPAALAAAFGLAETAFEAGIRPEHLTLAEPASAAIRGALSDVEPLGLRSVLTVATGEGELRLVADASAAARLSLGEVVGLDLATERVLAFHRDTGVRIPLSSTPFTTKEAA